jgi:hypothetical protein
VLRARGSVSARTCVLHKVNAVPACFVCMRGLCVLMVLRARKSLARSGTSCPRRHVSGFLLRCLCSLTQQLKLRQVTSSCAHCPSTPFLFHSRRDGEKASGALQQVQRWLQGLGMPEGERQGAGGGRLRGAEIFTLRISYERNDIFCDMLRSGDRLLHLWRVRACCKSVPDAKGRKSSRSTPKV